MSTGAAPKEFLPLTPDQKEVVGNLASSVKFVAIVLIGLGVIYLASGPYSVIMRGAGILGALLTMVQGVLTIILGLISLAVASDFRFLGLFPPYSGNHFRNAIKDLTMFHKFQLGFVIVIALVATLRYFV